MIKHLMRLSLSGFLILYLGYRVDWVVIFTAFQHINILFYLLSTGVALICPVILALKFYVFIKNTILSLSLSRLIAINFISRYYALLIPSALGPEAIRWYKVTKNRQGRSFFLASTLVERLFFLIILLFFGTIPLLFNAENQEIILLRQRLAPILISAYLLFGFVLFYFLFPGLQTVAKKIIKQIIPIKKNSKFDQFLENFSLKNLSFSLVGYLLLLSILWQFFFIGRMFFLFSALHLPLTLIDIIWMGSLVLLLQVLPISFAGIGIREGAYAYLFTLYGIPSEKGVLIGLLFFTQMLIFSSIGAILNLFEK